MAKREMRDRPGECYEPPPRMTIEQRANTLPSICSDAQRKAMRDEEVFLASITGEPDTKVFTKRGPPPMRSDLIR